MQLSLTDKVFLPGFAASAPPLRRSGRAVRQASRPARVACLSNRTVSFRHSFVFFFSFLFTISEGPNRVPRCLQLLVWANALPPPKRPPASVETEAAGLRDSGWLYHAWDCLDRPVTPSNGPRLRASMPDWFAPDLRPYQAAAVEWMQLQEERGVIVGTEAESLISPWVTLRLACLEPVHYNLFTGGFMRGSRVPPCMKIPIIHGGILADGEPPCSTLTC